MCQECHPLQEPTGGGERRLGVGKGGGGGGVAPAATSSSASMQHDSSGGRHTVAEAVVTCAAYVHQAALHFLQHAR